MRAALPCLMLSGLILSSPAHTAAEPAAVRVEMREFRFLPAVISIAAGRPATLRFVNRGQLAHQFDARHLRTLPVAVADANTRVESPGLEYLRLQPDGAASLQFVPRRRGRYEFACTIEGHREAGMTGIMVVK